MRGFVQVLKKILEFFLCLFCFGGLSAPSCVGWECFCIIFQFVWSTGRRLGDKRWWRQTKERRRRTSCAWISWMRLGELVSMRVWQWEWNQDMGLHREILRREKEAEGQIFLLSFRQLKNVNVWLAMDGKWISFPFSPPPSFSLFSFSTLIFIAFLFSFGWETSRVDPGLVAQHLAEPIFFLDIFEVTTIGSDRETCKNRFSLWS